MSTGTNPPKSSPGRTRGNEFIRLATEITQRHLQQVQAEQGRLFAQMLEDLWLAEGILPVAECRAIPSELRLSITNTYALDGCQQLFRFFLDFFSGGLAGQMEGSLSFTQLEFDGLKMFHTTFGSRLPAEDAKRLGELITMLGKS